MYSFPFRCMLIVETKGGRKIQTTLTGTKGRAQSPI